MAYSFGFSNFWTSINLIELKSANSTYPTGQLTEEQSTIVVSILNLGGLLGNFIIMPISQMIGIKKTLHTLGLFMIVSAQFKFHVFCIMNNKTIYILCDTFWLCENFYWTFQWINVCGYYSVWKWAKQSKTTVLKKKFLLQFKWKRFDFFFIVELIFL